ncbi:hypothetical protein V1478_013908 [Vespula squamosa]|uniref:Protein quiver n=1 Tax=Vespula squamosa TaxID=30214 RepID=A0ABD2A6U0_VESSQ
MKLIVLSFRRKMNWECPSIICILVLLMVLLQRASAIDCFKCVSIDGDNKPCDDPFHNNGSLAFLESPCLGGRKGRDGLFPATACIKISGIYDESGISLTVRSCALDSGTLTTDSEIIRMSHCGGFYFDDKYVRGCVQSCNDADACNGTNRIKETSLIILILPIFFGLLIPYDMLSNVFEQFTEFSTRLANWLCDTFESILDIFMDFLAKMLELILAMMNLFFQVMCFLRDLCIDAMRTYLNAFHGIVNIIKSIKCDDVEDFAFACIVVILWVEAIRIVMSLAKQKGSRTGNIGVSMGSHEIVKNSLWHDIEGYDTKTSTYKNPGVKIWTWFGRKAEKKNNNINTNPKIYGKQHCSCKKSGKQGGRCVKRFQNSK